MSDFNYLLILLKHHAPVTETSYHFYSWTNSLIFSKKLERVNMSIYALNSNAVIIKRTGTRSLNILP